jgi:hypothetical protein
MLLSSLACHGGEEGLDVNAAPLVELPRRLPEWCYGLLLCKILRAENTISLVGVVILGRKGDSISNSIVEASFESLPRISTTSYLQVVRPRR